MREGSRSDLSRDLRRIQLCECQFCCRMMMNRWLRIRELCWKKIVLLKVVHMVINLRKTQTLEPLSLVLRTPAAKDFDTQGML